MSTPFLVSSLASVLMSTLVGFKLKCWIRREEKLTGNIGEMDKFAAIQPVGIN
jgi:hypothetical protein